MKKTKYCQLAYPLFLKKEKITLCNAQITKVDKVKLNHNLKNVIWGFSLTKYIGEHTNRAIIGEVSNPLSNNCWRIFLFTFSHMIVSSKVE